MFDAYVCKETSDKNKRQKQAIKTNAKNKQEKTEENRLLIREYLSQNGRSKTSEIAKYIGLSPARTRAILTEMEDVIIEGANKNRKYRLHDKNNKFSSHWTFYQYYSNVPLITYLYTD